MANNTDPRVAKLLAALRVKQTICTMWHNDPLHSQDTLEEYCKAVATRYEAMYGEAIESTPEAIYNALQSKGML